MYSKFNEIFFVGMSNSEFLQAKKDQKLIEFKFLSRPKMEISDGCRISEDHDELHRQEEKKEEDKCEVRVSSKELKIPSSPREFKIDKEADDDDDGYHTPTSLDHKIPVIPQCPPAPRKPKPAVSWKRKGSSNLNSLPIEFSKEIESFFGPPILSDIGIYKNKKVRRENIK